MADAREEWYVPSEARVCIDYCNAAIQRPRPDGSFMTMLEADEAFSRFISKLRAEWQAAQQSSLTPRQQQQEDDRQAAEDAAHRDAEKFFAWWNEHKSDGEWAPGGPVQYGHVQRAFEAGQAAQQSETRITDEMVERAARAMFDAEPRESVSWDGSRSIRRPWKDSRYIYRERARVALVAALGGQS